MSTRYRGVRRSAQAARARSVEAERRRRDESAPVSDMTSDELTASIYRLQSRQNAALRPRIRELVDEKSNRLKEEKAV